MIIKLNRIIKPNRIAKLKIIFYDAGVALNWIRALTLSQLLKLPLKKLEP